MAQDLLVDLGEEYVIKNDVTGASITVGLYNDATDALSETSDVGDITTEPSNGNYARVTDTVSAFDDGNWGVENDSQIQFDFSDQSTSEEVDTAFAIINFAAVDTGDGGTAQDHLVANPALSQTRDLGSIDTLTIAAGDLSIQLD